MEFYKANEVEEMRFYRVPKVLFNNDKYKSLSLGAKMTYGILQDRFELSISNNWIDDEGYIYFIFTVNELCEILQVSNKTAIKIKKELVKYDLLFDKQIGLKKANRLYISKPELNDIDTYIKSKNINNNVETIVNTLKCTNDISGNVQSTLPKVYNLHTNDTDLNDTDFSDTQSVAKEDRPTDNIDIKINETIEKVEINLYKGQARELLEITIKKLLQLKELKIKSTVIKRQQIHQQLLKLDINTCDYALSKFRQVQQERTIKNKSNYFMVLLYTAIEEVAANSIY